MAVDTLGRVLAGGRIRSEAERAVVAAAVAEWDAGERCAECGQPLTGTGGRCVCLVPSPPSRRYPV